MDTLASELVAVKRRTGIRDSYRPINVHGGTVWPKPLPTLTGPEAIAVAKRLWRDATGKAWPGKWQLTSGNRRTWPDGMTFMVNPDQGWRGMVHDLSHAAHNRLVGRVSQYVPITVKTPGGRAFLRREMVVSETKRDNYRTASKRPHSDDHVLIEKRMISMILERGWLDGRFREIPKPKPTVRERNEASVVAAIPRWEAKAQKAAADLKRAKKKLTELKAKKRYYERHIVFTL
jgi:hypothetical protein